MAFDSTLAREYNHQVDRPSFSYQMEREEKCCHKQKKPLSSDLVARKRAVSWRTRATDRDKSLHKINPLDFRMTTRRCEWA